MDKETVFQHAYKLQQDGHLHQAVELYAQILNHDPLCINTYINMGACYSQLKKLSLAESCIRRALEIQPDNRFALFNLGNTLCVKQQFDEAQHCIEQVIAVEEADGAVKPIEYFNLGLVFLYSNRPQQALLHFNKATSMAPVNPNFHWHRALALLHFGHYKEGFEAFEWRLKLPALENAPRPSLDKRWRGEDLTDKAILLTTEQGFGDVLQFLRFLPYLKRQVAKVFVLVKQPLAELVSAADGVDGIIIEQDTYTSMEIPIARYYDYHFPLLSIPHYLNLADKIESIAPTQINFNKLNRSQTINDAATLRIGLVWAGKTKPADRSIPFVFLKSLLEDKALANKGVTFYAFQLDERRVDLNFLDFNTTVVDLSAQIKNFADTALFMQQMNLIITIDSAPAHLAGSLGIPTWLLLLYYSDWRWQAQKDKSVFYPNMRLFRQPHPNGWQAVAENLKYALNELMEEKYKTIS